jgi:HEAT repeat protein
MSIELIVMAMKDPDRDIQSSAARALGCIGPKAVVAIKELCELLQDCNDNRVACHCIVALREIGKEDRNVIRCVISQAGLYEKWTDVAIARTLGRIGEDSNEAYKQLREFIASSPETVVRVVAIRALGKIGRKTDLEFLLHAVKDDSGDVREEARKAIGVIRATEGESAK